jgi:CRP-like cAMP-binding protein
MESDERKTEVKHLNSTEAFRQERVNIPTLKYFWQASPLSPSRANSIPRFLRSIQVFDQFTDYELKLFSEFLHRRVFAGEERIIKEGESGYGFYLVFSGQIEIFTKRNSIESGISKQSEHLVARLSKQDYFGELALLEKRNKRNASALSKGESHLLAIYKPDLEEMIERYPVVGAKFLQAISLIVAMRFNSVTEEIKTLKDMITILESKIATIER